ncbi:MAG TPA: DUF1269 domain-containing protein [Gaiellales bacterium]|nr:DUF1269 domain-containing protein [Gaiellales bacterium]
MSNLTVWKFDSPGGGVSAGARVDTMAREGAVQLTDAATVEWAEDQAKPQTTQLMGRFAKGTMGRSFWRATFDLLLSGEQPENRAGEIPEALRRVGLDEAALSMLRREVTKGSSLLFLVAEPGNRDRMVEAFGGASRSIRLIFSDLPAEQEQQLRAAFTDAK